MKFELTNILADEEIAKIDDRIETEASLQKLCIGQLSKNLDILDRFITPSRKEAVDYRKGTFLSLQSRLNEALERRFKAIEEKKRIQNGLLQPLLDALGKKADISSEASEELVEKLINEVRACESNFREPFFSSTSMCGFKMGVSFEQETQDLLGCPEVVRVQFSVEKDVDGWGVNCIEIVTNEEPNHWVELPTSLKLEIMANRCSPADFNLA